MTRAALFLLLLAGCAGPGSRASKFASLQAQAKSLCEVLAAPNLYVGRRILVRGVYEHDPHHRYLFDRNCPDWDVAVSHSMEIDGNRRALRVVARWAKRDPIVRVPVVYSAVFTSRVLISGCTDPGCYTYSLVDAQLLAAHRQR